jgi:hypothetical protein
MLHPIALLCVGSPMMGVGQDLTHNHCTINVKIDTSLLICEVALVSRAFFCILTEILTCDHQLATFYPYSSCRSLQITGD